MIDPNPVIQALMREHTANLADVMVPPADAARIAAESAANAPSYSVPPKRLHIHAMPGRLILRFPPPAEKIGSILTPEGWRLRREIGELVAMGSATNAMERKIRNEIMRRTGNTTWLKWRAKNLPTINRLLGWKRPACKFLVAMSIGTYYYREELRGLPEFNFLADIRVYNITDLATAITEVE